MGKSSSGLIPGVTEDNPEILGQVSDEAAIKTPEQQAYADANAAIRAETIAKNKAKEAADAYDSEDRSNGAYGSLLQRANRLQSLSSAGRGSPPPTADDVAAAQAELADATARADEVLENTANL
jgi:hypothetical protein